MSLTKFNPKDVTFSASVPPRRDQWKDVVPLLKIQAYKGPNEAYGPVQLIHGTFPEAAPHKFSPGLFVNLTFLGALKVSAALIKAALEASGMVWDPMEVLELVGQEMKGL